MGAQHLAERGVEEMGARVVESQPLAAARLHAHRHLLVLPELALRHRHPVDDELGPTVIRVLDPPLPLAPDDRPGVAHLTAGLRVGGRAVEDDLDGVTLTRLPPALAVGDDRQDAGRRCERRVAEELGLGEQRRELLVDGDRAVIALGRPERRPRPRVPGARG